jgi:hypothetical protein
MLGVLEKHLTFFVIVQQNEFKSIVQGLNGRIVDEFSQEVTHVVTTVG